LSFLHIFPTIWTTEFEVKAIPQQALFAYSILPMFYLFFVFIMYFLHSETRLKKLIKIIITVVLYNKIVEASLNGFDVQLFFSIAGLGNLSALMILGFSLATENARSSKFKLFSISLLLCLSFISPFSQNIVYALLFVIIFILPKYSYLCLVGFISSTVIFYIVFINDPMSVQFIDQNLTVRLVLIKDAFDGFVESSFIGVGFGTESIKNHYHIFKNPTFFNQDFAGFIHLAVHNSFATIAYRLGLIGFLLFLFFMYEIIHSIYRMDKNKPVSVVLFLCFYIVTFQNPALESFVYLVGVFLHLGAIWALYMVEKSNKNFDPSALSKN
jgi:hypothetical protein